MLAQGDVSKLEISSLVETRPKSGKVGLKNLGNTCFMNSALQCLSYCDGLTKYFLSLNYLNDLNKSKETGGLICKSYYILLKEIWSGTKDVIIPLEQTKIYLTLMKQVNTFFIFLVSRQHFSTGCSRIFSYIIGSFAPRIEQKSW